MNKSTRKLQFSTITKKKILYRDRGECIYCSREYHMESPSPLPYEIKDIMHYVNKSAGGLGIEENGAVGCRYHHMLLDNGNKGLREEMLEIFKKHLMAHYPEWDESRLKYRKYSF